MTGTELATFITSLNGGDPIEDSLMESLVNIAKAIIEGEHDWRPLRKTDTSISFSAGSTWQTAYSLNGLTTFLRFQNCKFPIEIFDGTNRVEKYRQVPWEDRLRYKDINNTFVYDEANNNIYFNGVNAMGGTVYLKHIKDTPDVDLASNSDLKTAGSFLFPSRFHYILGFYAVGVHKGAVDYDEINRSMLPSNQGALSALKNAMMTWDTEKQLTETMMTDPYVDESDGFRDGHININQ